MRRNKLFLLLFLFTMVPCWAQQDSLSVEEFRQLVVKFHPVLRQAQLQQNMAGNELQAAKGAFDPIAAVKLGGKELESKTYYQQRDAEIRIPTWYGPEIVAGSEHLSGDYLNRSQTEGRVNRLGISIPLGKGLFFDERRAAVQQATVFAEMTRWEQTALINDLLMDAHEAYYDWWRSFRLMQLSSEAISINQKRYSLIRQAVELGERPAVDTVEARAQIQSFQLKLQSAKAEYEVARQKVGVYLWNDQQLPAGIPQFVYPASTMAENEDIGLEDLSSDHPALAYYRAKNDYLDIERRLKFQSFLPKLDFSYNFLSKKDLQFYVPFQSSYQYALKMEIPILLRSARALYENAQLKLEQNRLQLVQKEAELRAKVAQYRTLRENYQAQRKLAQESVQLYQQLLRGENVRFMNGEGSIFLINSRETKVFEAQEKLIETEAKYHLSFYKLLWAKNELWMP